MVIFHMDIMRYDIYKKHYIAALDYHRVLRLQLGVIRIDNVT